MVGGLLLCGLLAGCIADGLPGVAMLSGVRPSSPAADATASGEIAHAALDTAARNEARSEVIEALRNRRSVLPTTGPFAQVAEAVLASNKGAGAAEVRVARLKAEAKSKNWLPQIGPSMDLTSLGALAASILVEQVLFDNGKRKAERTFAAADVEVAAVALSTEMNKRVYDGLSLYVAAQRSQELSGLAGRAVDRMNDYGRIMGLRVQGGLSDRSEDRVVRQKMAEMEAVASADREAAIAARAELGAMLDQPLTGVVGLSSLGQSDPVEPLTVLKAQGEARRMVAEADMARAGLLPGLKANAALGKGGMTGGLRASADSALGFGTGDSLDALAATTEVATQRTASARDDANRRIVALERQISSLEARQAQGAPVLRQSAASLGMFTEQYKVGRRPLMELVGMYESFVRLERDQTALKYEIAALKLKIALERGVLVDGARM